MSIANKPKTEKVEVQDLRKSREKDNKVVKGIFRCYEPVGGSFTFFFKKYKGDPVLKLTMKDGEAYDVPLMVAKHLNQNCWYPKHSYVMDQDGVPIVNSGKKVKRCSFEGTEFMEDNE